MRLLALLMPLISLISFVGFVWLVVVAFKRSALWGALVLLLSPLAAIVFAIKFWQESKKPFLVYMGSAVVGVGIFLVFLVSLGAPMVQMARQMSEGEVSEEEAAAFIEQQMDRMENSGLLDAEDKAELRQMKGMVGEMREDAGADTGGEPEPATETLPATLTKAEALSPQLPAEPASGADDATVEPGGERASLFSGRKEVIPLREIDDHVGETLRVVTTDGVEFVGLFAGRSGGTLRFERHISSGTVEVHLTRDEIGSIRTVRRRRI